MGLVLAAYNGRIAGPDDKLVPPPDDIDPVVGFGRYIVEWNTLAFAGVDHFTPEQIEAAKATGWEIMTKAELLAEWHRRSQP